MTVPVDLSVATTLLNNGIGAEQKHTDFGIADWEKLFSEREEYKGQCCLSFPVNQGVKIIISKDEAVDFLDQIRTRLQEQNLI